MSDQGNNCPLISGAGPCCETQAGSICAEATAIVTGLIAGDSADVNLSRAQSGLRQKRWTMEWSSLLVELLSGFVCEDSPPDGRALILEALATSRNRELGALVMLMALIAIRSGNVDLQVEGVAAIGALKPEAAKILLSHLEATGFSDQVVLDAIAGLRRRLANDCAGVYNPRYLPIGGGSDKGVSA